MTNGLLSFWVIKDFAVFVVLGQVLRFHEVAKLTLRALVRHPWRYQIRWEQGVRKSLVHLGWNSICEGLTRLANLLRRCLIWPLAINVWGGRFSLVRSDIYASLRLIWWCLLKILWRGHRVLSRLYVRWLNYWLRLYFIQNLVGIVYVSSCRYISTCLYEMISELLG